MNGIKQSTGRAALVAHRAGTGWADFGEQHGADVAQAEPHSRPRFQRLVRRLLALVVAGNGDGQQAVGDTEPWADDDQAGNNHPADVGTAARIDWQRAGVREIDGV